MGALWQSCELLRLSAPVLESPGRLPLTLGLIIREIVQHLIVYSHTVCDVFGNRICLLIRRALIWELTF